VNETETETGWGGTGDQSWPGGVSWFGQLATGGHVSEGCPAGRLVRHRIADGPTANRVIFMTVPFSSAARRSMGSGEWDRAADAGKAMGMAIKFMKWGPYVLDCGPQGLAPGATHRTWWWRWPTVPKNFTATVTAHPSTLLPNGTTHASNMLAMTETSVQYIPKVQGDLVFTEPAVHALVRNTGATAVKSYVMYISFITED
jgi:hypothetical protein